MLQFFLAEEVAHLFEHELVLVCRFDRQVAALRVFDEPRSGELHVERFHTRGVSCFPFADRALGLLPIRDVQRLAKVLTAEYPPPRWGTGSGGTS